MFLEFLIDWAKNVEKTEADLVKKLKGDDLHIFHQAMVLFGRYICKAIKPECDKCTSHKFVKQKVVLSLAKL